MMPSLAATCALHEVAQSVLHHRWLHFSRLPPYLSLQTHWIFNFFIGQTFLLAVSSFGAGTTAQPPLAHAPQAARACWSGVVRKST